MICALRGGRALVGADDAKVAAGLARVGAVGEGGWVVGACVLWGPL
jgi:hypothetical protein